VEGRLNELRRWENETDEREKSEVSDQIREWQSFRPERSASSGGREGIKKKEKEKLAK
jgi:hypothetical protein